MGCHRLLASIGACFWLASCWHTHICIGLQYTSCKLLCSIRCWRMASFLLAHTHTHTHIYIYVCVHTPYIYSAAIRFCIACVLAEWVPTNIFSLGFVKAQQWALDMLDGIACSISECMHGGKLSSKCAHTLIFHATPMAGLFGEAGCLKLPRAASHN